MHKILTVVLGSSLLLASCGSSTVQKNDSLEGKKKQLDSLKDQQEKLAKQITSLEAEIGKSDSSFGIKEKAKLVTLTPLTPTAFTHYIDLQGNVEAENYSNIAPQGTGGVVRAAYVKQGDNVNKGQLLLKLDDAVQRQQVANAQVTLDHAKDLHQRRQNLWDQKIGAEVDLINAKNQVDQAEIALKIAQEQLGWTSVYSDIAGTVDVMNVKVGESFTAASAGMTALRVMNTNNLKVTVEVPEIYQQRVKVGTPVKIALPGLANKEINGIVRVVGQVINTGNRSFRVEVRLPASNDIRANQVAIVKLQDYIAKSALTIPVNTLQTDEKGKYVMVAAKDAKGKITAHKKNVTIGQLYADKIEVTEGLQTGDQVITDGFQGLYEGQLLTTE